MPKDHIKSPSSKNPTMRHNPLHEDMLASTTVEGRKAERQKRREDRDKQQSFEGYINPALSRKILKIAREQQDELEAEHDSGKAGAVGGGGRQQIPADSDSFLVTRDGRTFDEWEDASESEDDEDEDGGPFFDDAFGGKDIVEEVVVNEEDEELFNRFIRPQQQQQQQTVSLADKILEKIAEHEAAQAGNCLTPGGGGPGLRAEESRDSLPPKVVEVYSKIGVLLSRYKSGKLPKPFKIIPTLKNWEEILFLTRPETWSPHAYYEATKMFASNLNALQTQKFINLILLDRVREDIHENKKLNVHLYKALKKALYKPSAFNKGFLFPLCSSGTCTLREAQIIGSVLTRVSIPVLHSAAALQRLCDMDYTGPISIFIRVLLDKKYALPYKAVDSVVFHFLRFANMEDRMPLLWHQSLLSFATRYKNDITEDQRQALFELIRKKGHPAVAPQIILELEQGKQNAREYQGQIPPEDEVMEGY